MFARKSLVASKTIISQEIRKTKQVWLQVLCPTVLSTLLYFIVFGHLMGLHTKIIQHLSYLEFIAPGLIMMAMIIAAYDASVSTVFLSRYNKSIEEILISSMSVRNITSSLMIAGMLRGLLIGFIVFIVSLFFINISVKNIILVLTVSILSTLLFSLIGIITGIYIKGFDRIGIIPLFIIRPLSYLGGLFYPLTSLPVFWYKIAIVNPLAYLIDGYRQIFFYKPTIAAFELIIYLLLFICLLYSMAYSLIKCKKNFSH
ncbi:ABC transporter permease [Piscirickettsia litoralis]|uniref:Transport permease protein n=1 Tax=Piscirickettsia litoralis TaxID=1891921 RepID=A0ABX3A4U9_9GAMM|nr:ABC transporter permease [Piscirickettsia litoralis]ODN43530.1 hypothetical protein BGC07_12130 [Piscirickettsia litoralis]